MAFAACSCGRATRSGSSRTWADSCWMSGSRSPIWKRSTTRRKPCWVTSWDLDHCCGPRKTMMNETALPTPARPGAVAARPSAWRAWFYLIWLSWQRQLRERQMVLISLGLLGLALFFVAINTATHRWDMPRRHMPFSDPATNQQKADAAQLAMWLAPLNQGFFFRETGAAAAGQLLLQQFSLGVRIFFNAVVDGVFLTFLLPLWSMSFATQALGADRESNSLIWLLTRPLPRAAVYLGKFVAMLPWSLAL